MKKMQRAMKKPQIMILAVAAVMCMAVGGVAYAAGGQGSGRAWNQGRGPGHGMAYGPWANLTDEQMKDIQTMRQNFWQETAQLRRDLQIKRIEMRYLMQDPKVGQADAVAKLKEMQTLRDQLQEKRVTMMKTLQAKYPDLPVGHGFGRGFGRGDRGLGGYGPGACGGYGRGDWGRGRRNFGGNGGPGYYCPRW